MPPPRALVGQAILPADTLSSVSRRRLESRRLPGLAAPQWVLSPSTPRGIRLCLVHPSAARTRRARPGRARARLHKAEPYATSSPPSHLFQPLQLHLRLLLHPLLFKPYATSSPPSHLLQPLQLRLRLFLHPLLFIRTAHRQVLAVLAAALARRGWECPVDDGAIDRFQHVLRPAPRPI